MRYHLKAGVLDDSIRLYYALLLYGYGVRTQFRVANTESTLLSH